MQLDKYGQKALDLVMEGESLFITGKAGTGKTTVLREITAQCRKKKKNVVVLAPTGVAAKNAEGVTIHSFLHLPLDPYIPGMKNYNYHKNTDKQPGYFGRSNSRCFNAFVVGVFTITIWAAMGSCSDGRKGNMQQEQAPSVSSSSPVYEQPLYYPSVTPAETPKEESAPNPIQEVRPVEVTPPVQQTITISKYYEEGYEAGYDDGEDDAISGNGWGGQFDDSCRYKGKAKKDYQLGYEEGYEAGYYDNKDSDE